MPQTASPPPHVQAAARVVDEWMRQTPVKLSDQEFAKLSPAERLNHCRQFPQHLESGRKGA
jgi:hypothetical protein